MKLLALALVASAVLSGAGAPGATEEKEATAVEATAVGEWREARCRFDSLEHHAWTLREIRLTMACAVRRWTPEGGLRKALRVARCESGPDLRDPGGDGYVGTFQHAERYWPGRVRAFRRETGWPTAPSGENPRSNVLVSVRMAARGGWGPWEAGVCA